jgi:hypothetical protein
MLLIQVNFALLSRARTYSLVAAEALTLERRELVRSQSGSLESFPLL